MGVTILFLKVTFNQPLRIKPNEVKDHFSDFGHFQKFEPRSEIFNKIGKKLEDIHHGLFEKFRGVQDPFNSIKRMQLESFYQQRFDEFEKLSKKKGFLKTNQKNALAFFPSKPWINFCKDSLDIPVPTDEIKISAAKGEWETAQLAISAYREKIDSIKITIPNWPFKTPPQLYWGEYIDCDWSINHKSNVSTQDLLIPFERDCTLYTNKNITTQIERLQTKSVWIDCDFRRKDVKSGQYSINIELHAFVNNSPEIVYQIPFNIEISNVEISNKRFLKTQLSYNNHWSEWYYNSKEYSQSVIENHYQFFTKYNMTPIFTFPKEFEEYPPINKWKELNEKGVETFILFFFYGHDKNLHFLENVDFRKKSMAYILEREKKLDSLNLLEFSYIFIADEASEHEKHKIHETARILKKNGIRSKLYTTSYFVPNKQLFDAWVPLTFRFKEEIKHFTSQNKNNFKEKWAYICNTTFDKDFGNFFTDIPIYNSRKAVWDLYKSDIEFFQYYALNRWDQNLGYDKNGARIEHKIINENGEVSWNPDTYKKQHGDGQLVYPGMNGELWPSARLINFRDGLEDYELFKMNNIKLDSLLPFESIIKIRNSLIK